MLKSDQLVTVFVASIRTYLEPHREALSKHLDMPTSDYLHWLRGTEQLYLGASSFAPLCCRATGHKRRTCMGRSAAPS